MKKLLALAIFGLAGTCAFAQTSQGTIAFSGSFGLNKTTQENNPVELEQFNFKIAPSIGFMFQDGLELGASVGFNHAVTEQAWFNGSGFSSQETTTNTFTFAPYIKKYFMLSEKVAFTGGAFAGVTFGTGKIALDSDFGGDLDMEINGVQVGIMPGISFFPTEKIGINASFGSLGYNESNMKPEGGGNKIKTTTFGLNLDASTLAVGFSYYINR